MVGGSMPDCVSLFRPNSHSAEPTAVHEASASPLSHFDTKLKRWFEPPCDDPASLSPERLGQGLCSGEWITKLTTYDQLRVPAHLPAGEYVLGFRWDCESSAQVWQSCADVTITA